MPTIFSADIDANSIAIVSSVLIFHYGQSEGGVPDADYEEEEQGGGGLVAVKTSVVSQLPICGQCEMLTSAFFHVHNNSLCWAQRPALDCFIYLDAPAVQKDGPS